MSTGAASFDGPTNTTGPAAQGLYGEMSTRQARWSSSATVSKSVRPLAQGMSAEYQTWPSHL